MENVCDPYANWHVGEARRGGGLCGAAMVTLVTRLAALKVGGWAQKRSTPLVAHLVFWDLVFCHYL